MMDPMRIYRRILLGALSVLFSLAAPGCGGRPPHLLALSRIQQDRMDVILVDPDRPAAGAPRVLTPFSIEPHWNLGRTLLAFTRISPGEDSSRILSLYEPAKNTYLDLAAMTVKDWTGYGFAPAWHPAGEAVAFKSRSDKDSGVFAAILKQNRTVKLLPDPAGQIGEICWGPSGMGFTVNLGPRPGDASELRYVELPPPGEIGAGDPVRFANSSRILGPGRLPLIRNDSIYFLRNSGGAQEGFDIVQQLLTAGGTERTLARNAGPSFDIGPDGTVAFLSDPDGQGRPVRLTLLRPGQTKPEVTDASAFRVRFSPDGKRLAGIWVSAGTARYYVYDPESRRVLELTAIREGLSAQSLAELVSRPLFDW